MELNKEEVKEFINNLYTNSQVIEMIDDEICNGNWLDDDWEEEGYDDEYEWYRDYGRGEAEDVIMNEFIKAIGKKYYNLSESEATDWVLYKDDNWDWVKNYIYELHEELNTGF